MLNNLPRNEVHLYWINATEIQQYNTDLFLNAAEKKRAATFKFAIDRQHYQAAHHWLRQLLSRYAKVAPAAWHFTCNAYGKPFIANSGYTDLQFNLSHTKGVIACAIRRHYTVGVDVEGHKRMEDLVSFSNDVLAESERDYVFANTDTEQQQQRFFTCWTLKEAYIKALGMGLSCPLQQFSITLNKQKVWILRTDNLLTNNQKSWCFMSKIRPASFYLALAMPLSEEGILPIIRLNPLL